VLGPAGDPRPYAVPSLPGPDAGRPRPASGRARLAALAGGRRPRPRSAPATPTLAALAANHARAARPLAFLDGHLPPSGGARRASFALPYALPERLAFAAAPAHCGCIATLEETCTPTNRAPREPSLHSRRHRRPGSRRAGRMDHVSDLPRNAVGPYGQNWRRCRSGLAGRATLGPGASGSAARPAAAVVTEVQQRTAEQLFRVLGELKGGAMKFGQALSVFEGRAARRVGPPVPRGADRAAGETLPRCQRPPCTGRWPPPSGRGWRERFRVLRRQARPPRPRSGRCTARWVERTAARVAVKIQYPGPRARRCLGDLNQLSRVARLFGMLVPGHGRQAAGSPSCGRARVRRGAGLRRPRRRPRRATRRATPTTRTSRCRGVVEQAGTVAGHRVAAGHPAGHRDRLGYPGAAGTARAPCSSGSCTPARSGSGLLHADPHPGNFRLAPGGPRRGPGRPGSVAVRRARLRRGQPAAGRDAPGDRCRAARRAGPGNAGEVAETLRGRGPSSSRAPNWTRRPCSTISRR